jgi:DNA-directed RNA polymerase specialized sigma24 family protein
VDREQALERLPETHGSALRLRSRGFDDDAIAAILGLEPEAVARLLQVADAKLAALLAERQGGPTPQGGISCESGHPHRRDDCS